MYDFFLLFLYIIFHTDDNNDVEEVFIQFAANFYVTPMNCLKKNMTFVSNFGTFCTEKDNT